MTHSVTSVRMLGTGSSGGVPRIDGDWGDCDPTNPKNRRSRCSILVRHKSSPDSDPTLVVIDTSPDFREQMLAAKVQRLDALLYTHDHADQAHGIDDVRVFCYKRGSRLPAFLDAVTFDTLNERFGYCFNGHGPYPPIIEPHPILAHGKSVNVNGPGGSIEFTAFDQDHGGVRSLGFRFSRTAYCNDVVEIPETSFEIIQGVELLIVDALRYKPHPTHAHLSRALEWIDRVSPKRAVLTNLHIDMDYETLKSQLPDNVVPAFDGMELDDA